MSLISLYPSRSPLQAAARHHWLGAVKYLLGLGANVSQLSGKTGYALHAASRTESGKEDYYLRIVNRRASWEGPAVLQALLDHGADPNARGGKYETALQAAAKHGCLDNIKILLSAGADPTIEGGRYGSPLKAALAGEEKHYHVANYLRRYIAKMGPPC